MKGVHWYAWQVMVRSVCCLTKRPVTEAGMSGDLVGVVETQNLVDSVRDAHNELPQRRDDLQGRGET